jgi:hypothetical protein
MRRAADFVVEDQLIPCGRKLGRGRQGDERAGLNVAGYNAQCQSSQANRMKRKAETHES